jgi:hypothetical protein
MSIRGLGNRSAQARFAAALHPPLEASVDYLRHGQQIVMQARTALGGTMKNTSNNAR